MSPTRPKPWRLHPHLYQINTWAWLEELGAAAGRPFTLADVPDAEWDHLAGLGFDFVYLLGVWKRSIAGRRHFRTDAANFRHFDRAFPGWTLEAVVGSPFSITEYAPDPRIGDWAALDAVRAKLNARGMRLILDFVPNHLGPDHPWIDSHPEYFVGGSQADYQRNPASFILVEPAGRSPYFVARGRDPYFAPWTDTAQVNYFEPAARAAMLEVLRSVARHCDGVRCDMAMLVLNDVFARTWGRLLSGPPPADEFWPAAIAALPQDFLWMAEVYWDMEGTLQDLGFDFTYDKRLYDRLRAGNAHELRAHLSADIAYQSKLARFLENHDEHRAAEAYGRARLPGLAALIATLPGLRFFHQGQFEGRSVHLPMPLNAARAESADLALRAVYERVLHATDDALFHAGTWSLVHAAPDSDRSHEQLLAWSWRLDDGYALVVVNMSAAAAQGRLPVGAQLPAGARFHFVDALDDRYYERERGDLEANGLFVRLDGHAAHLFRVAAAA
ncbi:MAG: alpha-amylase [Acidobacteria bacterium]|nr:alpha-amylase [Acidobacteriota bacterium]